MVNYLKQDNFTSSNKVTSDRVSQINRSIIALTLLAERQRVQTKGSRNPHPTLTEEFFEGVRII